MKLHVRDDEESDVTWVSLHSAGDVCKHCGHDDHESPACPQYTFLHQLLKKKKPNA